MKKRKKNEVNTIENDDFLAQEAQESQETAEDYTLDIPDDEIWTYQIEGLQKPHINEPFENATLKKIIVVITLLIAIGTAIFLSVRAVHSDEFKYEQLSDGTYELIKYSNPGKVKEVTIDYVVDVKTGKKDTSKPITKIHEYAFNCDESVTKINIGKTVKNIDGKSIYSCWGIANVFVDKENPYYCDINGVLYNKDVTEIVFYPTDHDRELRLQNGYAKLDKKGEQHSILVDDDGKEMEELWGTTKKYNEAYYQKYNRNTRTYVVPSSVKTIGELAFAYSNITDLYIPEGVSRMENMAIFKNTVLVNIFSYKASKPIIETSYKAIDGMVEIYSSLPEGLEFIGSDCMYYLRGLSYMYIPSSVKEIKHHAFWDAVYDEDGELKGITEINIALDENAFNAKCTTGDQWRPQHDYMLFKKSVDLKYSAKRESQKANNIHREYYWAVQWIKNNKSENFVKNSAYLVKDMDGDGIPELVLRENGKDTILTIKYNYLDEYKGNAKYTDKEFSKLDDKKQLDSILKAEK